MSIVPSLLAWYAAHKRDLPWRRTRDPYAIWVSEIILQQTRIEQGRGYYDRFLERFPDVKSLASASEEEVLHLWQGLGYYTRARNMHAAAKQVMHVHKGIFPRDYEGIRALKGVGDYTAAAIGSIAFNLPYPVVDGNVLRFFARFFGVTDPVETSTAKKKILSIAQKLIPHDDPGTFNQAVMEFGALQCRPGKPDCEVCPLRSACYAVKHKMVEALPVKKSSATPRDRWFNYLVIIREKKKKKLICLRRRTEKDIWHNLYDFPLIESEQELTSYSIRKTEAWKAFFGKNTIKSISTTGPLKHVLSHQVIHASFYIIDVPAEIDLPWIEIPLAEMKNYPFPRLIHRALPSLMPDR
jgi:A/G-specific adenine glycosylase